MRQTDRQYLNFQCDRLEAVFAFHHVAAAVPGATVGPRWVKFQIVPRLGTKISQVRNILGEMALALQVKEARLDQEDGALTLEIPRADPKKVTLAGMLRRLDKSQNVRHFGSALLGMATDGSPLFARIISPDVAHVLVVGTTGAGKSVLLQAIIIDLVKFHSPADLQLILVDTKNRPFRHLNGLPHLIMPVITRPVQAVEVLQQTVALMEQRDRLGEMPAKKSGGGVPRVLFVIDEMADLMMVAGDDARHALARLAQRGREAGIHLLAGTQKPTAEVIGGMALVNFPLRIVGKVPTAQEAAFAAGIGGTGAETLSGPGDFLAVIGSAVRRFQGAYISPPEVMAATERFAQLWPPARLVSLPDVGARVEIDEGDEQLADYVAQVAPIWPTLVDDRGILQWGAKAAIAEHLFGERDTAGHRGKWVARVIAALREDPPAVGGGGVADDLPLTRLAPDAVFTVKFCYYEGRTLAWKIESTRGESSGYSSLPAPSSWELRSPRKFRQLCAFLGSESFLG